MRRGRLTLAGVVFVALLAAGWGSAAPAGFLRDGVRPGESAKPRFLRPPPPGTPVRIRPPGGTGRASGAVEPTPRQASEAWFWEAYSPDASAARITNGTAQEATRWAMMLATMHERRARGQGLVPIDRIRAVRAAWGPEIGRAARTSNLSEALIVAVIAVESGGSARALSPKGAQGLMQLIPATARRFGVRDAFDPAANIAGGAAYLDWLLGEFRGDILLALAGYNAGEAAVRRHQGVPPYDETRAYVVRVLDAIAAAGTLGDRMPTGPRLPCRWKQDS